MLLLLALMFIQSAVGFGAALADSDAWHAQELGVADVTANIDQATNGLVGAELGNYPVSYIRPLAQFARVQHLSLFNASLGAQMARRGLYPTFLTSIVVPVDWATVSGNQPLDAVTHVTGVSSVEFRVTGGALHQSLIANGRSTYIGWVAQWDTTKVANGIYALRSVAVRPGRSAIFSSPTKVVVQNS